MRDSSEEPIKTGCYKCYLHSHAKYDLGAFNQKEGPRLRPGWHSPGVLCVSQPAGFMFIKGTLSRRLLPYTSVVSTCKRTRRFALGSHHLLVPDPVENAASQAPLRQQKVDEPEHRQQQRHPPVVRNRLVVHPARAVDQDAPLNQVGTAL
jgi:hypothetical protein